LIGEWRNGADIVLARRTERSSDSYLKRTSARFFYRFHNRLSPIKIPENVGDFRLMNRAAVDALKQLPERNRFMKGLFAWIGFNTVTIDYVRNPRSSGASKFSGWKLWNFALEGFHQLQHGTAQAVDLRWGYRRNWKRHLRRDHYLANVDTRRRHSRLRVAARRRLFIGSIQLIGIGVLGEYIGRIYIESKQRPGYIVRKSYGHAGRR
jgi:glycosyltransferase involved in cell wall biosynthesis